MVDVFAGVCVGLTSATYELRNGLMTGALFSLWMVANQYFLVYHVLSNVTWGYLQSVLKTRWEWNCGLLLVLFLQVFICAVSSGLAYRWKNKV